MKLWFKAEVAVVTLSLIVLALIAGLGIGLVFSPIINQLPDIIVNPTPVTVLPTPIQAPQPELKVPEQIWNNKYGPRGGTQMDIQGEIITAVQNTHSMEPAINGESRLILRQISDQDPVGVGDIVLFDNGGEALWAHRIIADIGAEWIIKGDNRPEINYVPKDRVKYRVVGILY
jgi:hypothetical protein